MYESGIESTTASSEAFAAQASPGGDVRDRVEAADAQAPDRYEAAPEVQAGALVDESA